MATNSQFDFSEKKKVRLKRYFSVEFWNAIGNGVLGLLVATVAFLMSLPTPLVH